MTDSTDVVRMLQRHYLPEGRPAGGILAVEIASPDGRRRADAIWVTTTTVGRGRIIGHEVKVTRADVMVELADPTKMDAWARYCDQWYLTVSDPALVEGLDVPETWGIMAPPSGRRTRSMTVLRPAPLLHPIDKAEAMTRLLIWRDYQATGLLTTAAQSLRWAEDARARLEEENRNLRLSGATTRVDDRTRLVRDTLIALDKLKDRGDWALHFAADGTTAQDIAEALYDLAATRKACADARRRLDNAEGHLTALADPLSGARDVLAKVAQALEPQPEQVPA